MVLLKAFVGILLERLLYTSTAVSTALKIRCLEIDEIKTIGTSVKGAIYSRILAS